MDRLRLTSAPIHKNHEQVDWSASSAKHRAMTHSFPRVEHGRRDATTFVSRIPREPAPASRESTLNAVVWIGDTPGLETLARDRIQAAGFDVAATDTPRDFVHAVVCEISLLETATEAFPALPLFAVCEHEPDSHDYQRALACGARALRTLPAESFELLGDLSTLTTATGESRILACLSGHGGAGATSLAVALALAASKRGAPATLVDADSHGGGIDTLVQARHVTGARWSDLRGAGGSTDVQVLLEALPVVDGYRLLTFSGSRGESVNPQALESLSAAPGTLILDAPLRAGITPLVNPDAILVALHPSEHALAATARTLEGLREIHPRTRIGIALRTHRRREAYRSRDVADELGVPVVLTYRSAREGFVPGLDRDRRGIEAACARFLAKLDDSGFPGGSA